ncbi:MAG: gamma-glutamyltransferase [Bacillota bacterium]
MSQNSKGTDNLWVTEGAPGKRSVFAKNGMVASAHPLASAVGIKVLQDGGNAVDAAIAMAGVTGVVLPAMSGLGGDAFMIIYEAKTGKYTAINGAGINAKSATYEFFQEHGYKKMPLDGMLSVAVPGAVAAYETALKMFGSRPWIDLWGPAISLAENGHPVSAETASHIKGAREKIAKYPSSAAVYLKPNGEPYGAGEVIVQKDLAKSLRMVAEGGADVYYRGPIAEMFARTAQQYGGLLTKDDLAGHQTEVYEPISIDYRDYRVYQTAPMSQGLIMLEGLNILDGFDLSKFASTDPAAIHLMIEAKKLAYEDRLRYAGDPKFVDLPLEMLLSKEHAENRRKLIDKDHARDSYLNNGEGDTTSFVVVDKDGNAVSFIHSLSLAFGSGVVIDGTGILLNNRAGRGFTLEMGHPNCVAGGKRTMHTLNTYIVAKNGRPYLVGNTPGGDGQPQWNMQVLVNILDFNLSLADAVCFPRWTSLPGTDPASIEQPVELRIENRLPVEIQANLEKLGHRLKVVGPWQGGGQVQIIKVDPQTGVLEGFTDPRGEGIAIGH